MEFPSLINWTSPFSILGLFGGSFHFYSFLKETSVSKQWWTWTDAGFCGVWSGFALFADVPQKERYAYMG